MMDRLKKIASVFGAANGLLILFLGLTAALLMTVNIDSIPQALEVGSIAGKDIKADQNYEIVDEKSTEKFREEAEEGILPVYDFDQTIEAEIKDHIHSAFTAARELLVAASRSNKKIKPAELETQVRSTFESALGSLTDERLRILRAYRFHPALESALISLVHGVMQSPIIHDKTELISVGSGGFVLRKLSSEEQMSEEVIKEMGGIFDAESARKKLLDAGRSGFVRPANLEFLDPSAFTALKEMASDQIKPNMNYDGLETDARRQKAQANIKNVVIKIKRGESIIRSGDRFEPWHLTVIKGIRQERLKTNGFYKFAGTFLFVNLVLFIVYYYAAKYIRKFRPSRRDLVFLGMTLILFLITLRFGVFISGVLKDALPFPLTSTTLYYAIPMAAGAMLVRFILNSETALIFAVILSLFAGIFVENNLELTVFYLISGVFAAHVIAHVDKRSSVLLCGAYAGLVNALTVFSLNLLSLVTVSGSLTPEQICINLLAAFAGGLITSMMVLVLTPVCEVIFNYTTDIKLLELANLSHPLLREMIVRAPGTYHHSQLVGILSEAAAQAIGANPLLSRVACYYHDIGKMRKPHYFIENQSGDNAHDRLSPSMSALIIESHVKDGIEMAKEYKLPQRIADIIPQHQGTKLMGFFYNKAKLMEETTGPVDERDYRYPGPKPQTREAGIIMLADTVEAASRALPEKTPGKIRIVVEKMLNQHFVDEQLDECDLTLRDLHLIAEAFIKILVGIYHQRVEYENSDLKQTSSNISPLFRNRDKKTPSVPGAS